jgi:aspartyl/glutamyl-tRNA(Asn/Gln) amidotransferase C subunit
LSNNNRVKPFERDAGILPLPALDLDTIARMTDDRITRELFAHLVELAALELGPEEGEYIRAQLNNQLKAIEELVRIPLDESTPPAAHGVPYTAATSAGLREDAHNPFPHPEAILKAAPKTEDGHFVVPDIRHEDL